MNYGYIKTKRKITLDRLKEVVDTINAEHFKGLLKVVKTPDEEGWFVHLPVPMGLDTWLAVARRVWLKGPHKIVQEHGCRNDLDEWVSSVLMDAIALQVDGIISDDGWDGSWLPNKKHLFPTFASHLVHRIERRPDPQKGRREMLKFFRSDMTDLFKKNLPKEWHPLLGTLPSR